MTVVIGHEEQLRQLYRLIGDSKLPSTILFAGLRGIGKRIVAQAVAKSLFCEHPIDSKACGICKGCKLVESGNCPDFTEVDVSSRSDWGIEDLRHLLQRLHLAPYLGGNRVVIFDNCDQMNLQSANLLLKTLEEPREKSFFILLASNPNKIPPTILSRCQLFAFHPLSRPEIASVIEHKNITTDHSLIELLTDISDGSMEWVELVAANQEAWGDISAALISIAKGSSRDSFYHARGFTKDRDSLRQTLQLMMLSGRRNLLKAAEESDWAKWSTFMLNVECAERLVFERNLNAHLVVSNLFSILEKQSFAVFSDGDLTLEAMVKNY